jgi:hypothetical protein
MAIIGIDAEVVLMPRIDGPSTGFSTRAVDVVSSVARWRSWTATALPCRVVFDWMGVSDPSACPTIIKLPFYERAGSLIRRSH